MEENPECIPEGFVHFIFLLGTIRGEWANKWEGKLSAGFILSSLKPTCSEPGAPYHNLI